MNAYTKTTTMCPNCYETLNVTLECEHVCPNQPTSTPAKPTKMKAAEKLQALAAAGIDVSNLFSMSGVTGDETIARLKDGELKIVPDDDPIFAAILGGKTIPNRRLFRRWVMSQMFHMLSFSANHRTQGFTAALNFLGYKYQWKMMLEEFRVQGLLEARDPENFVARNRWFNKDTFIAAANHYIDEVRKELANHKIKHCKGLPYIRVRRRNVFTTDIDSKVYKPLEECVARARKASTMIEVYMAAFHFVNQMKQTYYDSQIPMSVVFKDAYKGSGAYYTMRNLIMFHGARFKNGAVKMSEAKSLATLEAKANEYASEGWRLFGLMKKLIADNNIDIKKKMDEWKRNK